MFEGLLNSDVQKFIRDHENDDISELVLKHREIHGLASSVIADQISARKKAKEKLPSYYHSNSIVYPPIRNLEQCSSEITARYKVQILEKNLRSFNTVFDLTGGFGVDSYYLSKIFSHVDYVEPDEQLSLIATNNLKQLGAKNISYHKMSAASFLNHNSGKADLVFIDPSRRVEKVKVVSLTQSEPNVISIKNKIFEFSDHFLVKASPMLDITQAVRELGNVKKVFVLAVSNEVKELLFLCERNYADEHLIIADNIVAGDENASLEFTPSVEEKTQIDLTDPLQYLYEPNAAILKAGAFKTISQAYKIPKIAASTHYYTSDDLFNNFPGRIFKIEHHVKPEASVRTLFPDGKGNVTTRNYPLSVEALKKKTKLKDGGEKFLIGFSGQTQKFLVVAARLK